MKWKFWQRNSRNILVRKFNEYGIHLLPIPREDVSLTDVYAVDGDDVLEPFNIDYLLNNPTGSFSRTSRNKTWGGIKGVMSNSIEAGEGLQFLEEILSAVTGGIISGLKMHYQTNRTHFVQYKFSNPTRDRIDPGELGQKLINNSINTKHPMYKFGRRYFVVTGILRSKSITIAAFDGNNSELKIDLSSIANSLTKLSISGSGQSEITYAGAKRLGFGSLGTKDLIPRSWLHV